MSRLPAVAALLVCAALLLPSLAGAAPAPPFEPGSFKHPLPPKPSRHGLLVQLPGKRGCLAADTKRARSCAPARALAGPGPFVGSQGLAVSPDGRHVYVAASKSDAIAVFARDPRSGALEQRRGKAGCVAAGGAHGCGPALGLLGPSSVAVSPDGRHLYATAGDGGSVTAFRRNRKTGALTQLPTTSAGCISGLPLPGCAAGRALDLPDVVAVSRDGRNVYVGSFAGNAVASFARNPRNGALAQLEGTAGCIAEAIAGCATGTQLGAVEGLAVSPDGSAVYAAAAASNAVAVLGRDPATGALGQATNGTGCVTDAETAGCQLGTQLAGANAVAVGPGRGVFVTSLLSDSVTAFTQVEPATIVQNTGPAGCLVFMRSTGCAFGRAMAAPEGIAVSPDGRNLYVAAFRTGAIDVLERQRRTGGIVQKPHAGGCVAPKSVPGCLRGRALAGVSSVAVSPDGRNVYATAFASNAVDVFRRIR